jgi:hypothetical protein
MKNKFWFKRKLYGWGWEPATKEGWAVIFVYIVLLILILTNLRNINTPEELILKIVLPSFVLSLVLIFVSYKKGEKPRWQWGKDLGDR